MLEDVGIEILGSAADADSLVDLVLDSGPDLVVTDIRMPPGNSDDGARAALTLREQLPALGIVLLSQHLETTYSVQLVAKGRFGYLLKDRILDLDDFVESLERVANGGSALDPDVVGGLLTPLGRVDPLAALSPRERDVLAQMAEGRTNLGIARRLSCGPDREQQARSRSASTPRRPGCD